VNAKKTVMLIAGIVVFFAVSNIAPPEGLTVESMKAMGVFLCAVCLWIGDVFPFFVTCLGMFCGLVLSGAVSFNDGFQGFSSSIYCFMLGAMGISVALTKSGLMRRISLLIMKLFSPTFKGQSLGLIITGVVINPIVPSVTAKTAMMMPFSKGVADAMGYEPRSKGMHGIYASAYVGITLGSFLLYTANFFLVVARGMLPQETQDQFTVGPWLLASLPWTVIIFVLLYFVIQKMFSPEHEKSGISKEYVLNELNEMGKLSKKEIISLVILVISVALWAVENQTGLPSHVIAVTASVLLLMLGVMDVKDFTQGVSWNMLIVIGVLFGLSNIFGQLGINEFFAKQVSPLTVVFGDRQWLLLIGMAVLIYLMRFFLTAQMAAIPIFVTIFLPLCQAAGISPWICAFVSATSSNVWNVLYQNTFAMQAYAAYDGEENIQYGKIAMVSVAYMVINIIAILLNFPLWKMTGLIA